jgi:hypothetical protein
MYVRVKRLKTTIFLETEPQETGIELKAKLQKLLDGKVRVQTTRPRQCLHQVSALARLATK